MVSSSSSPSRRRNKKHPASEAAAEPKSRRPSFITRAQIAIGNFLFRGIAEKLFDGADTNNDGAISLREVYTLVLQIYVHINRQSPIRPPPRHKVEALFRTADLDGNGSLSKEEFSRLAIVIASRASTRLVAHKVVSFVVAPLLAIRIVQNLPDASRRWLVDNVAARLPEKTKELVTRGDFWKTALTVVFVKTLGNVVISAVNVVLDSMHLKDDDDDAIDGLE